MNLKIKAILAACLLIAVLTFASGCAAEKTPYQNNDAENYNVSVKFDANGGTFTTNTSVIVDSYNISEMQADGSGQVQIALISPDDPNRNKDAYTVERNGYFLAGWYTGRTQTQDGGYTYSGKWDFENDLLAVDTADTYTAAEPVLTLYAAWVPLFEIELYSLDTGDYHGSFTFNPLEETEISVPAWDTGSGAVEMYDFPEKTGYTFNGLYLDAAGTQPVDTVVMTHPGVVDYDRGIAENAVMKLYVDWLEGEWYRIYNAEQFLDNASVNGSYMICADLDFTDEIWPSSLMYGNFNGTIQGNGHTFKNITLEQTNLSKVNAGLFGQLTDTAAISGLTFENVTFTVKAGTRVMGTSYGLLAGTVSDKAALTDVQILNSTLQIDSASYFGTDDYAIGLVCGIGSPAVDHAGITCTAVGETPEKVVITVNGNAVTLEFTE